MTTLVRHQNWPSRLHRIIDTARQVPFEWGVFDCALHVGNCMRAVVGVDPTAPYRGKYHDEAGAAAIYGPSLAAFAAGIAATLGCPEVPVTFARRGDVVWIDNATPQGALGVVSTDGRFASCVSDNGALLVRMHRWKRAWRVG